MVLSTKICGASSGGRYSIPDGQRVFCFKNGIQVGFDADLCRVIAAVVFGTSEERIKFVPILSSGDRWAFAQNKSVDVMACTATYTMESDVNEPSVGVGFEFTTPYLYNGVGYGGRQPFLDCVKQKNFTDTCSSTLICVSQGTTHVGIVCKFAPEANVSPMQSTNALYKKVIDRTCNAITEEQTGISATVVKLYGCTEDDYEVGSSQYSKEPVAVVTRDGDAFWRNFVYWVVAGLRV